MPNFLLKISHSQEFTYREVWLVLREWGLADTYPWMKRKAISYLVPNVSITSTIVVLACHLGWAALGDCGVNFQRGGSIIVLISALLFAIVEWHRTRGAVLDGGPVEVFSVKNPMLILPVQAALGTAVWGYGDLLPFFSSIGCGA